jgi:hypothetical protein
MTRCAMNSESTRKLIEDLSGDAHVRGRAEALARIGNRSALREHANDNVLAGSLGSVGEIAQAAMGEIERPTRTRKKG